MTINILTLFPHYFDSVLNESIVKRALQNNLVKVNIIDIRQYAQDKHKTTDDRPFGGGPGMVMKVEPIFLALESLGLKKGQEDRQIILTSAKGQSFDQSWAKKLVKLESVTIICGHYEGVDERVAENLVDAEMRIGDYVLSGGEPAANVILDTIIRLIPGALGNEDSNKNESHDQAGDLAYPQYTRPESFNNWPVPDVLLSGDHTKIANWRDQQRKK
ncbi:tRNA (guanosine(37)-N1)-methyltransferase TrmD [Patescibacteria group bacterium]|nr:tRNA (guanosine(37)-N1)-methyltransferase TrmD [Patescibacteria group bacterium]